MRLEKIKKALSTFANGGMVIVSDDHDRENEGDIIVSASQCTPEKMAFIIRHSSGIVCAPMSEQKAKTLDLNLMASQNEDPHKTAFTVSVDARKGMTTGISARQRANTVQTLATSNDPRDLIRPGHIFPLIAKTRGVFERAGHTEAAVDLCRLTAMPPVAVIAELMNDDGTVMRGAHIAQFAHRHELPKISVAELIEYRLATESVLQLQNQRPISTPFGTAQVYEFGNLFSKDICIAAHFKGAIHDDTLVHVCIQESIDDLLNGHARIGQALAQTSQHGGVFVLVRVHAENFAPIHSATYERQKLWRRSGVRHHVLRALRASESGVDVRHACERDFALNTMAEEMELQ